MDDIHISRTILRAVEQGELPKSFLEEVVNEHLLGRCPHCRAEVEAYQAERQYGASGIRRVESRVVPWPPFRFFSWRLEAEREQSRIEPEGGGIRDCF